MGSPVRGLVRWCRSGVLALVVLGVSATAHAVGGGALASPVGLAALGVVLTSLCWGLARWRLSLPAVAAVLGGGQLVLHQALMAMAPMPMPMSVPETGGDGVGWPMVASHVVATVVLAVLLADGERALWCLCAWLAPLLVLPGPVRPVVQPARRLSRCHADVVRPHDVVLRAGVPRRGPPVVLPG